jgi:hypothetical protein
MPEPKYVERRICNMLDMGDEELLAELDEYFLLSDERHQKISNTLEEMMQEVDRLISRIEELEDKSLEDEYEDRAQGEFIG